MKEALTGKVVELKINKDKGTPGEQTEESILIADKGVEGDRHSKGGVRQVSILSRDTKEWMKDEPLKGFCLIKFKENIVVDGIDFNKLKLGMFIVFKDAILEVSELGQICFSDCPRREKGLPCEFKSGHLYATVVKGGKIKVGDSLEVSSYQGTKQP
jgi:MOSC domain-containing protein YiiM